ncbi:MAG: cytochrome C [Proteobacteria bacterium]|nr:cytochrome C [Pseudomonadota bacterium]
MKNLTHMRLSIRSTVAAASLLTLACAQGAVDGARAKELATKNACLSCHAVNTRIVGPAYTEVAAKYKGMDPATLVNSIRAGSKSPVKRLNVHGRPGGFPVGMPLWPALHPRFLEFFLFSR